MDSVTTLHRYVAYTIPAGWGILTLWSLYAYLRNRDPGDWYWRLLGILQVILGIQVVVGITLFISGRRPDSNGPTWLHYTYGAIFPLLILVLAHRYARRYEGVAVIIFGVAAFLCFGLTFRALQTGLGID